MQHKNLYIQICNDYGKVCYSYKTHVERAVVLNWYKNILEWLQIILSAISTTGFINIITRHNHSYAIMATSTTVILLILNLLLKNKDWEPEIEHNHITSNKLWGIMINYCNLLTKLRNNTKGNKEIISKYKFYQHKTRLIYKAAPLAGGLSYHLARHAIKYKEDQFFSINELNRLLPPNLRINTSKIIKKE